MIQLEDFAQEPKAVLKKIATIQPQGGNQELDGGNYLDLDVIDGENNQVNHPPELAGGNFILWDSVTETVVEPQPNAEDENDPSQIQDGAS